MEERTSFWHSPIAGEEVLTQPKKSTRTLMRSESNRVSGTDEAPAPGAPSVDLENPGPRAEWDLLRRRAERRVERMRAEASGYQLDAACGGQGLCEAIHEQHVLQEELRMQNEELLRTQVHLACANDHVRDLFDYAPVGYVTMDRDGKILDANQTAATMFRVRLEKLSQSKLQDYVERGSQDAFYLHRLAVFDESGKKACELQMTDSEGARLEIRLESVALRHDGAAAPGFCRTALLDVTGEREARGWRELAEQLQQMVEELPAAAVFVTGSRIQLNRAAESLTGYSRHELATVEDWFGKLLGKDEGNFRALYQVLRERGFRDPSPTVAIQRKGGGERIVELVGHRFHDREVWLIHDLTERVRAEEGFRRTQLTVDHSREAIFWVSPDGRFQFVNQAACELTGYPREELLGLNVADLAVPVTGRDWTGWWRRLQEEGHFLIERRIRSRAGDSFPISLSVNHLEYCGEEFACLFVRDISARRRMEEALRESESRLRQIAEQIEDVVMLVEMESQRVLYCSPNYERIWGRPVAELYRSPLVWLEGIHPKDLGRVRRAISEMKKTGSREEEYRVLRPDGSERCIRDRAFPIWDEGGKVYRIAVVAEDVTERKAAEADQARLAALVESSQAAILAVDLEFDIRHWNPAAERLFGYKAQEIIGRPVEMLIPPSVAAELRGVLSSIQKGTAPRQIETVGLHRDGTRIDLAVTISLIRCSKGEALGMSAIVSDIRERKQLERQVSAATEEEQKRIAMELHDVLGSTLTFIDCRATSFSRLLEKAGHLEESREARGIAVEIRESIKMLRNLTGSLQPLDDDPASLVAALRDLAYRTGRSGRMKCPFKAPAPDAPLTLRNGLTASHLLSIAREAVHNAVRHSGGSQVTIQLAQRNGSTVLSISDNGKGFCVTGKRESGLGIGTMQYRARLIGAVLSIRPRSRRGGTEVLCEVGNAATPAF